MSHGDGRALLLGGSVLVLTACLGAVPSGPRGSSISRETDAKPAASSTLQSYPTARPYGAKPATYADGTILPSHVPQAELTRRTALFYDRWREKYLSAACGGGQYVVRSLTKPNNLTVSEAHGYGMILSALFAGHDPDAQAHFDGMVTYFLAHPSHKNPRLMAWFQTTECKDAEGEDSATDGDLDIAYAFLLADRQWGSCGAIDYFGMAQSTLQGVRRGDVDPEARYTLLGDWVNPKEAHYFRATRPSDFTFGHFPSFAAATGEPAWRTLTDNLYELVDGLQRRYSPDVGLVSDFVRNPGGPAEPSKPDFLETKYDGDYSYNACRVPWRLGTAFLATGEPRAKRLAQRVNLGMRRVTRDDPTDIRPGYLLSGKPIPDREYRSMAFTAPLGVSAMVDAGNQVWLNRIWDVLDTYPMEKYYEDTLRLLAMVAMSGNWWAPESAAVVCRR